MIKYLSSETSKLFETSDKNSALINLLWGDRVRILDTSPQNGRLRVKARGIEGFVDQNDLGEKSLLEIYFIDVGQGDGILIRTPDDRHILIDGGYARKAKPEGKNAADFVDWKFHHDYEMNKIVINDMISSHCDADHYGGLWDLINPKEHEELKLKNVEVENFYHAGISWWIDRDNERYTGPKKKIYLSDCWKMR